MEMAQRAGLEDEARESTGSYDCDAEYIRDEMKRLDLLIRIRILEAQDESEAGPQENALDSLRGLVLTEERMLRLLDGSSDGEVPLTAARIAELQGLIAAIWRMDQLIAERKAQARAEGISLTLPAIVERLGLTSFEEQCLLVCLAPEWDAKYGKLFAYLHDDVMQKEPTVELLLRLLCTKYRERVFARQCFASSAPLLKHRLLEIGARGGEEAPGPTLLAETVRLDRSIAERLLGHRLPDAKLEGAAVLLAPGEKEADGPPVLLLPPDRLERAVRLLRQHEAGLLGRKKSADQAKINVAAERKAALLLLHGPSGAGKRETAALVCEELNARRVRARTRDLLNHRLGFAEAVWRLCREAWLEEAVLILEEADSLFEAEPGKTAPIAVLFEPLERYGLAALLLGERAQPIARAAADFRGAFAALGFPLPDSASAAELWRGLAAAYPCENGFDPAAFSNKFRFSPGKIDAAFRGAWNRARWRDSEAGAIREADLLAACYEQTNHKLGALAERVVPRCGWEDLILPDDQSRLLRELVQQVRYRTVVYDDWGFGSKRVRGRGLNALFHGPPGTGKTTAAEVIALELGQELYRIDLSQIVSKYIGETEKNLQRVFQEAEESCAILFFDEADAIFGKRTEVKDAHDRHANTEIAYLLQRMEAYDGITILATNLLGNLDEAFIRRMAFSVLFPLPDEEQRLRIWEAMFPPAAPRSGDVDLVFLARQFALSGGHIRNIVHTAAFFAAEQSAAIGMTHVLRAVRREMEKMGRMVRKEDFGPYGPF